MTTVHVSKVIDLSHALRPGKEARRLQIEMIEATQITGAEAEDQWYVMHWIGMDNHIGTHIEVPYHAFKNASHLGDISAEQLVGEAVILDVRGYAAEEGIPLEVVQRAAEEAGGIDGGNADMVFCMTGWSRYYGRPEYDTPPFLTREAVRWLVDQGIGVLGVDTCGRMDPSFPDRENHLPLFEAGVAYIENLTNLEDVPKSRVTAVALPPAIEGLEGFPVRVVALL